MKPSKSSLGPSAQKIIARIQKVRKSADKAARSERRFADYRYLRAVLRAYVFFSEEDLLDHLTVIAPSTLMTPVRADWHPLRVIIEASCNQPDLRMRSRWTRALEYAIAEKVDPKDLSRFIRAHNGITGCAYLASKTKPKRSRIVARMQRGGKSDIRRLDLASESRGPGNFNPSAKLYGASGKGCSIRFRHAPIFGGDTVATRPKI